MKYINGFMIFECKKSRMFNFNRTVGVGSNFRFGCISSFIGVFDIFWYVAGIV